MTTLEPVNRSIDHQTILNYADLTNDYNPIHVDPEFAAKTAFKGQIAHGTMSVALIWQSLARTLGQARLTGVRLEIKFAKPVRIGDEVTGSGESTDSEEKTYTVAVKNQRDEVLISGIATLDAI
jgi:3-hydroxybutyryl-CoA dehydratase